jgi:hypothetical protein
MHGHDFLLLAEGLGDFDASVLSSANLKNPMRRDVVVMPAPPSGSNITGAYIVIAFQLDNPGCWVLCLTDVSNLSFYIVILRGMFQRV